MSSAHAAPVLGPAMPAKGQCHVGFRTHAVLDNAMEGVHGETKSLQHLAEFSYGVTDRLSLDLQAGVGNIRAYPDSGNKIVYNSGFAGGYGFRIKAYEKNKVTVVAGFQHISVHPYADFVGNDKYQAILDDWQVSALAAYSFERITPYVGIKAGRMDYTYWVNEHDRNRVKSDETKTVGLALGMNIGIDERSRINLEVQLFDVEAVTVGMVFAF